MLNIIQTSQVNHYITIQMRELHGGFAVEIISQGKKVIRFDSIQREQAESKYQVLKDALEFSPACRC